MPWELEIHHIDVNSTGDSTLIIAKHPPTLAHGAVERVLLIDAGKKNQAANVDHYITNTAGVNHVDVMISTHYDNDHFSGMTELLTMAGNTYDNAVIYDPGAPPDNQDYYREYIVADHTGAIITRRPQRDYLYYIQAINLKPTLTRATMMVNSFKIVHYNAGNLQVLPGNPAIPAAGWVENRYFHGIPNPAGAGRLGDLRPVVGQNSLPPNWLVGKEVMWGNGGDGINGRPAWAAANPAHAGFPTLTCITANKWTQQPAGGDSFVSDVNIYNGPNRHSADERTDLENGYNYDGSGRPNDNAKSLGFILEFNNFRYYIAGDLEEVQEDGHNNINPLAGAVFKDGVRQNLNPNGNMAGRVLGMHTSHHGSNTATSRDFVSQLLPSAAFVSCSDGNQFRHPAQRTVNVLDGYPERPINSTAAVNSYQHPNRPPAPPHPPVNSYLTGFQRPNRGIPYAGAANAVPFVDRTNGGDASFTAGDPINGAIWGHVVLEVTADESNAPVEGIVYRALNEAITVVDTRLNTMLGAPAIAAIAELGAKYGVSRAVAEAVGGSANAAIGALENAAWVGKDQNDASIVETADGGMNAAAAVAAIQADARLVGGGAGLAEAIGHTVKGDNAAAITAAINAVVGADAAAATAAGHAGDGIDQAFTNIAAGYAAAAAMGALVGDGATSAGVACAIASAIGAEAAGNASVTDMVHSIYDNALAAGLNNNLACLGAIVGGITYSKGQPGGTRNAVLRGLLKRGISLANAIVDSTAARTNTDLTHGGNTNDLFRVTFNDDDPAYTGGGGANPRTISHTT